MKRVNIRGHNTTINNLSPILILFGSFENRFIVSIINPTAVPIKKYIIKSIIC